MWQRSSWLIPVVAMVAGLAGRPVFAHAVINEAQAYAGEFSFVTVRITHGCGDSPTTEVRVKIPEGVIRVSPRWMPGWTAEKRMRKLAEPYRNEIGQLVTETVDEIVWRGGPLPDGYYLGFQIRALMPKTPGVTLWFKTIQNCEQGSIRWIAVPAPGQSPWELKEPSPFLKLVARPGADDAAAVEAGDE